jgi:hypothetical protein
VPSQNCGRYEELSVEHKEGALDTLLQLCRIPSFLIDLYLNFDCNLHCTDLFEVVVAFLAQNAFPEERVLATHLNALDSLLTIVHEISSRDDSGSVAAAASAADEAAGAAQQSATESGPTAVASSPPGEHDAVAELPLPESLAEVKRRKGILEQAVVKFNESASSGIKFLVANGMMSGRWLMWKALLWLIWKALLWLIWKALLWLIWKALFWLFWKALFWCSDCTRCRGHPRVCQRVRPPKSCPAWRKASSHHACGLTEGGDTCGPNPWRKASSHHACGLTGGGDTCD